jgi:hypothetical protein
LDENMAWGHQFPSRSPNIRPTAALILNNRDGSYSKIRRGEWGYAAQFGGKMKQMEGTSLSVADTTGLLDVSRAFVSSGLPEHDSANRGWPGLFA